MFLLILEHGSYGIEWGLKSSVLRAEDTRSQIFPLNSHLSEINISSNYCMICMALQRLRIDK